MKGLLFREFYLARKYYILSFALFIIISLLGILVRLSIIFGNLSSISPDRFTELDSQTLPIFTYLPTVILIISACTDGGVTYSDYASKWATYIQSCPVKESKTVAVKFIFKIMTLLICTVFGTINAVIIHKIAGENFRVTTFLNLSVIVTLGIVFSSIIIPLSYKYKTKNAVTARLVGFFAIISVPVGIFTYKLIDKYNNIASDVNESENIIGTIFMQRYEEILNHFSFLIPVIVASAIAVSFICSVNILRRREN